MSLLRPAYMTRYGYTWRHAVIAEFWWRVEHSPLDSLLNGYSRRKAAERRGAA